MAVQRTPEKNIPNTAAPPNPPVKRRITEEIEGSNPEGAEATITTNTTTTTVITEATNVVEDKTKELFLRFSGHVRPFQLPTYPEVALAGLNYFRQEGMVCTKVHVGSEIVYKFMLQEPVLKVGHAIEFTCGGSVTNIPLYVHEPRRRRDDTAGERAPASDRKEGTLLTFRRAGQGALANIPAQLFDKAIEDAKLQLIVPTKMQRIKGTQIYNGNRFCVVETPEDKNTIPASFPITDPTTTKIHSILVNYKGQERYCARCNITHVEQCPELKAFYEARNQREEMRKSNKITAKIYSDSTLRHGNALGLSADVCTMSGGGLGQIVQATLDDPDSMDKETIVIIGGTNDIKQHNFTDNGTFAKNIDISLQKLQEAAKAAPQKQIVLVNQNPCAEEEAYQAPNDVVRRRYLHHMVKKTAEATENVSVVEVEYDIDETGHPTIDGTWQIITQLSEAQLTKIPLVWNEAYACSEKPYRDVEAIYRYGCNGCLQFGTALSHGTHNSQLLCDTCYEKAVVPTENKILADISNAVENEFSMDSRVAFPNPKRVNNKSDDGMEFS